MQREVLGAEEPQKKRPRGASFVCVDRIYAPRCVEVGTGGAVAGPGVRVFSSIEACRGECQGHMSERKVMWHHAAPYLLRQSGVAARGVLPVAGERADASGIAQAAGELARLGPEAKQAHETAVRLPLQTALWRDREALLRLERAAGRTQRVRDLWPLVASSLAASRSWLDVNSYAEVFDRITTRMLDGTHGLDDLRHLWTPLLRQAAAEGIFLEPSAPRIARHVLLELNYPRALPVLDARALSVLEWMLEQPWVVDPTEHQGRQLIEWPLLRPVVNAAHELLRDAQDPAGWAEAEDIRRDRWDSAWLATKMMSRWSPRTLASNRSDALSAWKLIVGAGDIGLALEASAVLTNAGVLPRCDGDELGRMVELLARNSGSAPVFAALMRYFFPSPGACFRGLNGWTRALDVRSVLTFPDPWGVFGDPQFRDKELVRLAVDRVGSIFFIVERASREAEKALADIRRKLGAVVSSSLHMEQGTPATVEAQWDAPLPKSSGYPTTLRRLVGPSALVLRVSPVPLEIVRLSMAPDDWASVVPLPWEVHAMAESADGSELYVIVGLPGEELQKKEPTPRSSSVPPDSGGLLGLHGEPLPWPASPQDSAIGGGPSFDWWLPEGFPTFSVSPEAGHDQPEELNLPDPTGES